MNKSLMRKIAGMCATLGPIGYFLAPGTVATIVTIPFVLLSHVYITSAPMYALFMLIFFIICMACVQIALPLFAKHRDPSQVVLDEVIGCFITFWAIPLGSLTLLLGFILFRLFDITKFGAISRAENLYGAWGIVMDDVLAAIISNIILRIIVLLALP